MFGSIKIAAVRGIPIRVHFTLLIVFFMLVLELGWLGLPAGFLLFSSVLAHELGHAFVAQRYGIGIAGIDLHLLGGTAMMRGTPAQPKQEMAIAIAGPAVSLALALVFGVFAWAAGISFAFERLGLIELIPYVAAVNLAMAIFNLVPALPMDGGRVLRAALAMKLHPLRATRIAAYIARGFAVGFVLLGLYWAAWTLPLIGAVIWVLAGYEQRIAERREAERQMQQNVYRAPFVDWPGPRRPSPFTGPIKRIVIFTSRLH